MDEGLLRAEPDPSAERRLLEDDRTLGVIDLLALWRQRDRRRWAARPDLYEALAQRLTDAGEPLMAHDVAREGSGLWPRHLRLRQLLGFSLARAGAARGAQEVFESLRGETHPDGAALEETLGGLARTYKDLAFQTRRREERARYLERAHEAYLAAWESMHGYWTGINVATLAVLRGDLPGARKVAGEVAERCRQRLRALEGEGRTEGGEVYWVLATLGEASLIQGRVEEACEWYGRAVATAGHRTGDVASTRRNARVLLEHLEADRAKVEACLPLPRIVVFSGHMIDRPDRPEPRFPPDLEAPVREALKARLEALGPVIGFASAACGSDILFLEEVQRRGWETHVVLPYEEDAFCADSVDLIPGADWPERYRAVLEAATHVSRTAATRMAWGSLSYEFASQVLLGLALNRAQRLETSVLSLAVWDGRPGDGPGGTASIVERWRERGLDVERIDTGDLLRRHLPERSGPAGPRPSRPPPPARPPLLDVRIKALLFADVKGFSGLTEEQIPDFVRTFLGTASELLRAAAAGPAVRNTWGDALYCVFDRVRDAGLFALDLSRRLAAVSWKDEGLPEDMATRIALHAGPVYRFHDPVIDQETYGGTHASHAARIEPVTPPGFVYASQAFAALAAVEGVSEFVCEYVGETPLAKEYGVFPTYHVRPAGERRDEG